jgi:hypothetical protein
MTDLGHPSATTRTRIRSYFAAPAVAAVTLVSLSACGGSDAEAGDVTTEELQQLQDQLSALDNRVATLEQDFSGSDFGGSGSAGANDEAEGFGQDPAEALGDEVTVSAEVSRVLVTKDAGTAFFIAGDDGVPIPVVSADPSVAVEVGDAVEVAGTVFQIRQNTFSEDFGVASEDLFDDPDAFMEEREGELAIAADDVRMADAEP